LTMTGQTTAKCAASNWAKRIIVGTVVGESNPPGWIAQAYAAFHANIVDSKYPCYFGSNAERAGKLYYSYISGAQVEHLPITLQTFLSQCTHLSRDKNNLVVFFEPERTPKTHAQYRSIFWETLQHLHDHDPAPDSACYRKDPSDPFWDFPFAGKLFFVVGLSPSYQLHRSRNLTPGLAMVFQPREVFQDYAAGKEISETVREVIRQRAEAWDGIGIHPDLNVYGSTGNIEWAQYFISDDNSPEKGGCPFSFRKSKSNHAEHSRAVEEEAARKHLSQFLPETG
jgi:uncharacterized protein